MYRNRPMHYAVPDCPPPRRNGGPEAEGRGPVYPHCNHHEWHDVHPHHKRGCENAVCGTVIDDINDVVYLYGNVYHENYHIPDSCQPYVAVASAGFEFNRKLDADEFFDGEQSDNTVRLQHAPLHDNTLLVFLNGVKQREGADYDYVFVSDKAIKFNFYDILETDRVEVMYEYTEE